MKAILISLVLIMPSVLLAEANIPGNAYNQTFLLEAPGTVTSMGKPQNETSNIRTPPPQAFVNPGHEPANEGGYRFPQYGQKPARDNPWQEDMNQIRPSTSRRSAELVQRGQPRGREFQNPWDLRNLPDFGPHRYELDSYPGSARGFSSDFGPGGLDNSQTPYPSVRLDPGLSQPFFPYSGLPYMNGMLPGLGKDDSGFPFMPFDMF
jgi:hypothetical protein